MDNPCKTCRLSANEIVVCCGCPDRLEWEREQKNTSTSDNLIYEQAYRQGYEDGFRKGCQAMVMKMNEKGQQSCANCANCPKTAEVLFGGTSPVCSYFHDCLRNGMAHWKAKEVLVI